MDTYGKTNTFTGESSFIPFRYQGQYEDAETGIYYNRFRYYDPETGRYISEDPIGFLSGEFKFYNYVDDSNAWVDVFGEEKSYMPNWMKSKKKHERHHIIPKSLRNHNLFVKSRMDINSTANMIYLPRFNGTHKTKTTHSFF